MSCFIERLNHYVELTERERAALTKLEERPEDIAPGDRAWSENDPSEAVCIVQSGWLMSYTMLPGGERQILRLHFPGDIVGAQGVAFSHEPSTVVAITESRLCRFPREALGELYANHPRLAALFYSLAMIESVDLSDRLRSLGRTAGMARVAHFLLSVLARKRVLGGGDLAHFDLPLTQADLADIVGLTKVHVNRLLRQMTSEGLIAREGRRIHIADMERLAAHAHFIDRFQGLAHDWFPAAR